MRGRLLSVRVGSRVCHADLLLIVGASLANLAAAHDAVTPGLSKSAIWRMQATTTISTEAPMRTFAFLAHTSASWQRKCEQDPASVSKRISQVRKGMTKEQVRAVLGTPTYEGNDVWEYVFGDLWKGETRFTVTFKSGEVSFTDRDIQIVD